MPKKITMDAIADKLGISKNTVSLALRGFPGISETTKRTIEETAKSMGYRYKSAKTAAARNLCLVIAKSTRDSIGFFSYIQLGIEDEAKRNNFNTIIHYYDETDEVFDTPNCIKDGMISGIITLGGISHRIINSIINYNLPVVMVDNYFDDLVIDCILTDNQCGGYIATEHLIKSGHTRIGFIGDISASVSFYDRYQGYLKAMRAYNIEINPQFSLIDRRIGKIEVGETAAMVHSIKQQDSLPTAFFCCNDAEAIVMVKVLTGMGISLPEDISIVGFDDIETAKSIIPELSTMRVSKELMGRRAVLKLIGKINEEEIVTEKILLSPTFISRQSVKELKYE